MERRRSYLGLYTMGIAALFLAGFLLLVSFGAGTYRDIVSGQEDNNQTRALRSYITTCVKANENGEIYVEDTDQGQTLVIRDGDSEYGIKIYQYNGNLMESYCRLDAENVLDGAQVIGKTKTFSVEEVTDDVLAVTTDKGRTLLATETGGDE